MRTIVFLNLIVRVIFGFLVLITSFFSILFILRFFKIDLGFAFNSKNIPDSSLGFIEIFIALLIFLYFLSYMYAIYLFRKCLDLFTEMRFFDHTIIRNFKIIGYIFLVGFIVNCTFNYLCLINELSVQESIPLNIEFSDIFLNPLNGLILSLFFIVLSKVFQIAKNQKEENIELKQENELTI